MNDDNDYELRERLDRAYVEEVVPLLSQLVKAKELLGAMVEFWDAILAAGEPKPDGRELFLDEGHYGGENEREKAYELLDRARRALGAEYESIHICNACLVSALSKKIEDEQNENTTTNNTTDANNS